MVTPSTNASTSDAIRIIDEKLSQRFIALDPKGYFLIRVERSSNELILEHYTNNIDESGRAIDPENGKPIECSDTGSRTAKSIYKGRSAKELGAKITEGDRGYPLSKLDHALYLGRELQKAEACLINGEPYIQD